MLLGEPGLSVRIIVRACPSPARSQRWMQRCPPRGFWGLPIEARLIYEASGASRVVLRHGEEYLVPLLPRPRRAEASDGACDLIKALAEAWAPDLAERYVIDSAEAAVGVATDLLREEFGAAVFKAQATDLLDRLRYCMPGHV